MKRLLIVLLVLPLLVVAVMGFGFVISQVTLQGQEFPVSESPPNWSVLAAEEIPSIVTFDRDGDRRITQLWLVALDNRAYLRTGNTAWFANLERNSELQLRIGGVMFHCHSEVVREQELAAKVNAEFYAKYPSRSDFFRLIGVRTETVLGLDCGEGA